MNKNVQNVMVIMLLNMVKLKVYFKTLKHLSGVKLYHIKNIIVEKNYFKQQGRKSFRAFFR